MLFDKISQADNHFRLIIADSNMSFELTRWLFCGESESH
jgi:hypothetical protein